jgi:hypothetical protein
MTRDAFLFLERYLHFSDSSQMPATNCPPLFKIQPVLDVLTENMKLWWTAGQKICIDESMILYKGRAISFGQYMPAKPIKHGIKVFVLCCAVTGFLLSFEVYTGAKNKPPLYDSNWGLIDKLICSAGLVGAYGRILYTDNYYTSMTVARKLYELYHWLFVGTYRLTTKERRGEDDFQFHKLSNGAMKSIPRGWSRRATREFDFCYESRIEKYCVQCTVWKDKKQVAFLHTHKVCSNTEGQVVFRREKGKRQRLELPCPPVQPDYAHHFNGVDIQDKDSANYPTTLKTNRWYMRIFFWCLDRIVFGVWLIVMNCGVQRIDWQKYHKKNGRFDFQIDLGLQLIDMGIQRDWDDISDAKSKPKWMRQKSCIPCNCNKCFFCRTNKTSPAMHSRSPMQSQSPTPLTTPAECTRGYWPLRCFSPGKKHSGNHCVMCVRARKLSHPLETARERRKHCRKSYKGCRRCQVEICPECWENYNHDIVKKVN